MISQSNVKVAIILTERGLTISGTRITLYDVMDYVKAQYPAKFIQGLFELTDEQINAALSYIELNRDAVEAEYAQVVRETEELQIYYANQNRDRLISTAAKVKTGNEAAWKKLEKMRSHRELKV
ncbi:DUF433 domain-containing protein [Phormidium tenue]|jgi:uncharacterized protein (DUF433 family)|uniref:DUF433 domain-containing protein n=1 Tax=Phormidium tenue FACHB-1050 TaxID=2692857 RepID=A0ABR8CB19_9CYAN|nr:DUF433 domain-containing protein [Phormidium tenue]MBD2317958.1 DUF433 domain-containing protein [Phormidium tenue FACHB-1050]